MNENKNVDHVDQACTTASTCDKKRTHMQAHPQQSNEDPFQLQVEKLLALLGAQSRGEKCNAEIEQTLSTIVPTRKHNDNNIIKQEQQQQPEITNCDNEKSNILQENIHTSSRIDPGDERRKKQKVTMESLRQQEEAQRTLNNNSKKRSNFYRPEIWNTLDDIPFGRAGAKMMVTFGDGHNPKPDAVAAVLMGTRQCLQYAIKDARALRRKQKREFVKARIATSLHTRKDDKDKFREKGIGNYEVDPAMIFRAVSGYDPLSYDTKVGFDVSQLEILFPEEMNAYKRWEKMHNDYEVSSKKAEETTKADEDEIEENDKSNNNIEGGENANKDETKDENDEENEEEGCGGHLRDRLAQFDARTSRMEEGWYMEFAEVRQGGSFLSRRSKNTIEDKQWNLEKKRRLSSKAGGPRREATWETLNSLSVQFLHWIGFDPSSSLPPPNEEITEALAFLGHDFLGKIVEKAIFLRLHKKASSSASIADGSEEPILELGEGEQLEVEDIERALNDTSINSAPLYNATNSALRPSNKVDGHALQLYFGPGFEDRLEMELDQMLMTENKYNKVSTATDLSDEELQVRAEEDELFSKLTSIIPTKLEGVSDILGEVTDEQLLEQREKSRKKQASLLAKKEVQKQKSIAKKQKVVAPTDAVKVNK